MRIVFIGAGALTLATAPILIDRRHDVVIIESNRERIDGISDDLDCGFIHGDGTKPAILREVGPKEVDLLFCLTENDQDNILASLVGRSQGFKRVVTRISSTEYEQICAELNLTDTIIPNQAIGRTLADMAEGESPLELSTLVKGDARFYSFRVREGGAKSVEGLDLPEDTRVVCLYRDDEFLLPDADTGLKAEDEVVLITHRRHLTKLEERFGEGLQERDESDDAE